MPQYWVQSYLWLDLVNGFELYRVVSLFMLIEGPFGGCAHHLLWLSILLDFDKHFIDFPRVILSKLTTELLVVSYLRASIFGLRPYPLVLAISRHLCLDWYAIGDAARSKMGDC